MQTDSLACPICYNQLDQAEHIPRIIPNCGHTICTACLIVLTCNQRGSKCPIDKKPFPNQCSKIDDFPVNFLVTQLLEGTSEKELTCQDHNEQLRFICLTDKIKVCDDCICCDTHKGHEITSMKKVKIEADAKRKDFEDYLMKVETYHQDIQSELEGRRATILRNIKDKFEELRWILNNKERQLTFEVNSYFAVEKEKFSHVLGDGSILRKDLGKQISDLSSILKTEEFLKTDNYFKKVQETLQNLLNSIDFELVNKHMVDLKNNLGSIGDSFDSNIKKQTEEFAQIEFPLKNFSEQLLSTLSENIPLGFNEKKAAEEADKILYSLRVRSVLSFSYQNNRLEILADTKEPREIQLNIDKWRNAQEIKMEINQYSMTEKDTQVLVYLWKNITNPKTLNLKFSPAEASDESIVNILKTFVGGYQGFEKVTFDFEKCSVTDRTTTVLIEKILSKFTELKQLNLNFNNIQIRAKTFEALAKKVLHNNSQKLEDFRLFLNNIEMNDDALSPLFVEIPNLANFSLSLSGTTVSDKSIRKFVECTGASFLALQSFELYLHNTKVTDSSIEMLVPILKNVKKISLDLGCTSITDQSIETLATNLTASILGSLEEFVLSVGATKVSDQSITKLFVTMPQVKKFLLGLYDTAVTDKTIEAFVQNAFLSMKALESFEIWLRGADITDYGLEMLFMNIPDIKNLKKLSLDLRSTKVTDKSLELLIKDKLPIMHTLEELQLNTTQTQISDQIKNEIEVFSKKLSPSSV